MRLSTSILATAFVAAGISCIANVKNESHVNRLDVDRHGEGRHATASIGGRSGSSLEGHAIFIEREGGVLVELTLEGAPPGWHAVHIHEVGDCSSEDFTSAKGHFNPAGHDHGSPHAPMHHAGDLGNMWVDDLGNGFHALFMPELEVSEGEYGVIGRGIIVHAGTDDLASQPTGAAGGRIGCGEIR